MNKSILSFRNIRSLNDCLCCLCLSFSISVIFNYGRHYTVYITIWDYLLRFRYRTSPPLIVLYLYLPQNLVYWSFSVFSHYLLKTTFIIYRRYCLFGPTIDQTRALIFIFEHEIGCRGVTFRNRHYFFTFLFTICHPIPRPHILSSCLNIRFYFLFWVIWYLISKFIELRVYLFIIYDNQSPSVRNTISKFFIIRIASDFIDNAKPFCITAR